MSIQKVTQPGQFSRDNDLKLQKGQEAQTNKQTKTPMQLCYDGLQLNAWIQIYIYIYVLTYEQIHVKSDSLAMFHEL